jgi:DnaJ-class molecular chaperone
MRGDERWSTGKTQAVIALGCPKPVQCDVCDGTGFYMVHAHGTVQEIECGECGGTGVKPAPSR